MSQWERTKEAGRAEIIAAIHRERAYQDRKWGSIEENPHRLIEWVEIIEGLLEDTKESPTANEALQGLLEIAATAVAAIEQHGVVERN